MALPCSANPGCPGRRPLRGSKIDDAWYKIDPLQAIVRWVHGKAPNQAALAVRLTQDLSPKEVTLFWKKLAIVVPILAALVTGLIGWATRPAVKTGNSGAYYETWSLRGKVKIDKDMFPHYQVQAMIRPPSLPLMADGSFKEDIPVRNRANGSRDFPSITFDSQAGGYDRPVVHLDDKSKLSTDDLKDQVLVLKDDIVFTKLSPYSSAHAEKEQKLNSGAVGK